MTSIRKRFIFIPILFCLLSTVSASPKVILVHGLSDKNGFFFLRTESIFRRQGFEVQQFTYETRSVDLNLEALALQFSHYFTKTYTNKDTVILTHSQGALIVEAAMYSYLRDYHNANVRVIMLSPPRWGAGLPLEMALDQDIEGRKGSGQLSDLFPFSDFLKSLADNRLLEPSPWPIDVIAGKAFYSKKLGRGDGIVRLVEAGNDYQRIYYNETNIHSVRYLNRSNVRVHRRNVSHFGLPWTRGSHMWKTRWHPVAKLVMDLIDNNQEFSEPVGIAPQAIVYYDEGHLPLLIPDNIYTKKTCREGQCYLRLEWGNEQRPVHIQIGENKFFINPGVYYHFVYKEKPGQITDCLCTK